MFSSAKLSAEVQRREQIAKLEKRILSLQNEMDFVEILVQFWPWPNMAERMERKQQLLARLQKQVRQLQSAPSLQKSVTLPFNRFAVSTSWSTVANQKQLSRA